MAALVDLVVLGVLGGTDAARAGATESLAAPADAVVPAAASSSPAGVQLVTYPSAGRADDTRGSYYVRLLKLALSKADTHFDVRPAPVAVVNLRALAEMAAGRGIDVLWIPTTAALERDFLPVRVSLDKGLLGWRVFLVREADREAFAHVRTLDDLRAFPAGQVTEWVDTEIMRANGLRVEDTTHYANLFPMLAAGRFRFLPRGVGEIEGEARNYGHLGLVIEPHVVLHYPFCTYFFVRKDNVALAHQLELGLQRARHDGSFEALFQEFNGPALRHAALERRAVIELRNPTMAAGDAAHDACSEIEAHPPRSH